MPVCKNTFDVNTGRVRTLYGSYFVAKLPTRLFPERLCRKSRRFPSACTSPRVLIFVLKEYCDTHSMYVVKLVRDTPGQRMWYCFRAIMVRLLLGATRFTLLQSVQIGSWTQSTIHDCICTVHVVRSLNFNTSTCTTLTSQVKIYQKTI